MSEQAESSKGIQNLADQIRRRLSDNPPKVARELSPVERVARDARVFMREHERQRLARWIRFAEQKEQDARKGIESAMLELEADAAKANTAKAKQSIYNDVLRVEGVLRELERFAVMVNDTFEGIKSSLDDCPIERIRSAIYEMESTWKRLQEISMRLYNETGIDLDF